FCHIYQPPPVCVPRSSYVAGDGMGGERAPTTNEPWCYGSLVARSAPSKTADAPDATVSNSRAGADAPDAPVSNSRAGADAPDAPETLASALAAARYLVEPKAALAVWLALQMSRPLLVEGPAGVGKTDLARACAEALGRRLIRLQCYEGLDEAKALYEWD